MSTKAGTLETPSLTVVIPTRNRSDLLAATLASVAAQTRPPAETVVADDGSTDATAELLADAGVTTVRAEGRFGGASQARNAGLARVDTPLVLFLDSDDLLLPTALERLATVLAAAPGAPFAWGRALSAWGGAAGWAPDGLIASTAAEVRDPLAGLLARNSVPSSGVIVRTEAARVAGGYPEDAVYSEDHLFWIRLARRGRPVHLPEVVSVYRRHAENRHTLLGGEARDPLLGELTATERRRAGPERMGVFASEAAIEALKARRGDVLWALAAELARRPGRRRALRRGGAHLRARRRWARDGAALWAADPALRDWLSGA